MKNLIILVATALLIGCSKAPQAVQQQNSNTASEPQRSEKMQTVTAHTTENQPAPMPGNSSGGSTSKWSQSGEPIDTTKFDAAIADAEKNLKAKPADDSAKKALAEAYYQRGVALTDARQYAAALGDYRRALKYDPNHADAKQWIDQIIMIYGTLKKDYPKEGEEPPPLPFKKA